MRLAVGTAAVLAAVLAVTLAGVYTATAGLMMRSLDRRLVREARGAFAGDARGAPPVPPAPFGGRAAGLEPEEHRQEREREEPWEAHEARKRESWRWAFRIREGRPDGPERGGLAWLWPQPGDVRVVLNPASPAAPAAGQELHELAEVLGGLRLYLAGIGLGATLLVSGVAFESARRAFRPVQGITQAASRIVAAPRVRPDTLEVRVPEAAWSDASLHQLVQVLNTMLARLQEAFVAQARFVDDASHELRTPLGALQADLEVALRELAPDSPCRPVLARSLAQVQRLGRLAEDLLGLARYEHGKLVSIDPDADVGECARAAIADVRHLAERRGAVVVTELPAHLPAACDRHAVARLVTNLLQNALDATPPGGEVLLKAGREGPDVVMEVSDSGPGMAPEEACRAFEPFFCRAEAAGPSPSAGTGLGLAICRAIVEAHGGQIYLETEPGRGTRVRVRLPAAGPVGSARPGSGPPPFSRTGPAGPATPEARSAGG